MSFHRIIDWATMVEHELAITGSSNTVAADRLQEKLGWVKDFEVELNVWRECRHLVGHLLRYANDQGVFPGASETLRSQLAESPPNSPLAQSLSEEMISQNQSLHAYHRKARNNFFHSLKCFYHPSITLPV